MQQQPVILLRINRYRYNKKKKIVVVRCEAVIFEVLKTCVYLAMAYLLGARACFFSILIVKSLLQLL